VRETDSSPITTREAAEATIRAVMPPDLQERIIALLRPAIRITAAVTDDAAIPIGASKFGGAPDAPPGFSWPFYEDEPLAFIAQFNLAEIAAGDVENALPHEGLLAFYFGPESFGEPGVIHTYWHREPEFNRLEIPTPFLPKPRPQGWWANLKARLSPFQFAPPVPPCRLSFETRWQLPELDSPNLTIQVKGEAWEEYNEVLWDQLYGPEPQHQLLGHCASVQGNVQSCIAQSAKRLDWKRDAAQIEAEAREWRLLFQQDSQEWLWGDAGKIYFMIRREDLAARRFEKVAVEFQCG
jgi:hypothetical protein